MEFSSNKIKKIVLTGGPCGGKTTALATVAQELKGIGYNVIIVPEAATQLLVGGVSPETADGLYNFQNAISKLQISNEKIYENIAKCFPDKTVLLLDRGATDGKAFCVNDMWDRILKENNWDDTEIRDNYDIVLHLTTTAKGAEEYYGNATNEVRRENIEQARIADDKCIAAYSGHPNFKIIGNHGNFEDKMVELMTEIKAFLGEKNYTQKEDKFVAAISLDKLKNNEMCHKTNIIYVYLNNKDNDNLARVEQHNDNGHLSYYLTQKHNDSETKRKISYQDFNDFISTADSTITLTKDRYYLPFKDNYFKIDVFPEYADDIAIISTISAREKKFIDMPNFIECVNPALYDNNYDDLNNINIAKTNGKLFIKAKEVYDSILHDNEVSIEDYEELMNNLDNDDEEWER